MDGPGLPLLLTAVAAPLLAGLASLALPTRWIGLRVLLALLGPAAAVGCLLALVGEHGVGAPAAGFAFVPDLNLNISFAADRLGLFFGLLIAGMGALIVLYARGYFGPDGESLERFYPLLGFFATAMMGLVLSDNVLLLFLFWELTSISSFLLIGWRRDDTKAVRLAMQAFVVTGLGGMALLGGLLMLGVATGEWTFSGLARAAEVGALATGEGAAMLPWAFGLIFLGAAAKSAQWPLHFWLPGAMAAPTPVSAYLHSATMVKAGVYLLARLYPSLHDAVPGLWTATLVLFGAVTMLLGGYVAFRSQGLKRIFAYTTVSQLGLLVCAYGLGGLTYGHGDKAEANLVWPVTQILNHALYKAALFMLAGAIMHSLARKELGQLKGLLRTSPLLAGLCLLGTYALGGLPFTLSFVAKEAFLSQITHGAAERPWLWAVGAMAVLTAVCNVAIFVRFLTTFLAPPEPADDAPHAHDSPLWASLAWLPAAFLLAWQVIGGVAPGLFEAVVRPVETHALYWDHLPGFVHAVTHPTAALGMSALAIGGGVALGLSPLMKRPVRDVHDDLFPSGYRAVERLGMFIVHRMQTGSLRDYIVASLSILVGSLGLVAVLSPEWRAWPGFASMAGADEGFMIAGIMLTLLICANALLLPILRSRVVRVLVLGACGFCVTGMYLVYAAPDLALTQLMFEIISVVLFLLVLRLLPRGGGGPRVGRWWRMPLAASVGLAIGWIVLHAGATADRYQIERAEAIIAAERGEGASDGAVVVPAAGGEYGADAVSQKELPYEGPSRLGDWFLYHSYKGSLDTEGRGGGGNNVVNVILVDFRGYDTLGEITVLAIAMMGVLALLGAAPAFSATPARDGTGPCPVGPQPHLRTHLLRTAMRVVLPFALIFAAYLFFKGHQEPGGGFIAGLVAAVGLAVYRMSEGSAALKRLIPFRPGVIAAVGLSIALATGLLPLALGATPWSDGAAFLTSYQGYVPRAGADPYHMPSVLFFDLGVFIVVVGVSVGMINRFEEELE